MKQFLLVLILMPLLTKAQLNGGTITPINGISNAPFSFATVQGAATYLAANGVAGTGDVVLEMTSAYTASGEPATGIVLDSIPNTTANRRVIFRPATGTTITISLNVAGNGTLNLQRVNFVTFDGRAGGAGTVKRLTITNTSTSGIAFTGALKLINSSKNNQFLYCNFNGFGALATSSTVFGNGVIQLGDAGTFSAGNNGNKLYRCDVNGNSSALQLLVSKGSTTTPSVANFRDTIRGCNFFDNFSNLAGNIAINLHQGNDEWVVDSNNIYQTVSRTYSVQALHTGINTVLAYTGEAHTITNNNIGGSSAGANGMMTLQGATTNAVGYIAISCQHGEGTLIINNTIRNITLTYAASAGTFGNAMISVNMQYSSGLTNVGNNNISNINFSNTNGFVRLRTVYLRGVVTATAGTFGNVQPQLFAFNNIINNITATGSGGVTASAELVGVACESASPNNLSGGTCIPSFYIYDNKMTQLSATSAVSNTGTFVRGIFSFNTQGTSSASTLANYNEFIKDTIAGLSTNATLTSVAPGAATAIFINSGLTDTSLVQQCDISNIANTNAGDISNAVCGIAVTNGSWDISQNRIYDLRNASTGATQRSSIMGINVRGINATSNVYNNQISIGSGQNNNLQVYGIINNFSAAQPLRVLYNSILISGSPTAGATNSSAIYRGSDTPSVITPILTPFLVQNNLCINTRSGGTGIHSSIYSQATTGDFTSDYNTFVSANTAQAGQWGAAAQTFATWKASSAGDIYSYYAQSNASSNLSAATAQVNLSNLFFDVNYVNDGGLGIDPTKAECWLVAGKGKPVPEISTSFNRNVNPAIPVCIGSYEFIPDADAPCSFESTAPGLGGTTNYSFAGRNIMSIAWGNTGTVPSAVCVRYYSGKNFTPAPAAGTLYSISYWGVTAATGSGYTYSPTINFSSSERGTVTFADASVKQSFFNGSYWNYLGAGSTAVTSANPATSTSTGVNRPLGSNTALILTDVATPLPVDLMNFTARRNKDVNFLQWSTEQEINSSWFIIERSSDGRNFAAIGRVAAAGNSSITKHYTFTDNAPIRGFNYYRLRITDRDNNFRMSETRRVRNEGVADVAVYPNPVIDKLTVNVQADRAIKGQLLIMDISGKLLQSRTVNLLQGQNLLPVDAAGLQKGTYIIKILLGEEDVVVSKFTRL